MGDRRCGRETTTYISSEPSKEVSLKITQGGHRGKRREKEKEQVIKSSGNYISILKNSDKHLRNSIVLTHQKKTK